MQTTKTEYTASIGTMLLDAGKINAKDIESIIALQKKKGIRFGDAAKSLGLVNDDDLQAVLSQQFDFPYLTESENNFSQELVAAYQPFSPQVEALRTVRGQLMLRWFIEGHKALALVSPNRGEGRSYIAANLAIVFSQLGERTLLIDADLRNPRQHELFKLPSGYGLSEVLAGRAELDAVITQVPAFRDLSVLSAGAVPPNPAELISRGLKGCLQQLQAKFDVILIDTPSTDQGMETQIIATNCGAHLLVPRQNETRRNNLQILKEMLETAGSQCLGAVLSQF